MDMSNITFHDFQVQFEIAFEKFEILYQNDFPVMEIEVTYSKIKK